MKSDEKDRKTGMEISSILWYDGENQQEGAKVYAVY